MDISMLSIDEAAKLIRTGKVSPVDLVDACVDKVKKYQPACNAYVYFLEERAREEAKKPQ